MNENHDAVGNRVERLMRFFHNMDEEGLRNALRSELSGAFVPRSVTLIKGNFYDTQTQGNCQYEGLDNYMGEITHQFYSLKYRQRIYCLPERLKTFLTPAAAQTSAA